MTKHQRSGKLGISKTEAKRQTTGTRKSQAKIVKKMMKQIRHNAHKAAKKAAKKK